MNAPPTEYLTADQIASELQVNVQAVQRLFRDGDLPGRKIGGGWRTTRAALDAYVLNSPHPAVALEGTAGLDLETK